MLELTQIELDCDLQQHNVGKWKGTAERANPWLEAKNTSPYLQGKAFKLHTSWKD